MEKLEFKTNDGLKIEGPILLKPKKFYQSLRKFQLLMFGQDQKTNYLLALEKIFI